MAKLQNPDSFGNDYTVYVNKLVESETAVEKSQVNEPKNEIKAAKPGKKTAKSGKKTSEKQTDELPF